MEVSPDERFYCIEVCPDDRFYCIEVSPDRRFHGIEVCPDQRFHCIEVSPDQRFNCIEVSPDRRFYGIEVCPDQRFHCIEVSHDPRFYCSPWIRGRRSDDQSPGVTYCHLGDSYWSPATGQIRLAFNLECWLQGLPRSPWLVALLVIFVSQSCCRGNGIQRIIAVIGDPGGGGGVVHGGGGGVWYSGRGYLLTHNNGRWVGCLDWVLWENSAGITEFITPVTVSRKRSNIYITFGWLEKWLRN